MLQKDSNVLQCTVKPHIPLTHTVPSPDLETPAEPDSLACLHTSAGGGWVKNKVQLHSKLCGCQCLLSTRHGAAVLTHAALTLSGWRTQPVSSFLAAPRALIWTLLRLRWRAGSLDGAAGNCQHCGGWGKGDKIWMSATVEPLFILAFTLCPSYKWFKVHHFSKSVSGQLPLLSWHHSGH